MKDQKKVRLSPSRPAHLLPWWLFVMLAVGSYTMFKYVLPELHSANPTLQQSLKMAPTFAPLASILFLLLAAKRLYDNDHDNDDKDETNNTHAGDGEEH